MSPAHVVCLPTRAARILVAAALLTAGGATSADAAGRLGDRTLRRGAHGADVRELQRTLQRLRLSVRVDGAFGPGTGRAVRRYERRVRIAADGVVTPGEARGMRGRAGTLALGGRALARGDAGKDVRRLQELLGALGIATPVDGRFGAATARGVVLLQQRTGQRADGRLTREQAQGLAAFVRAATAQGGGAAPGAAPATTVPADGVFPIAGAHHAGGSGTGFGDRGGRHQGVDAFAACGTRLVAPLAGTVRRVASEAAAGNYLVLHAASTGEDLVMMHLRSRAVVDVGDHVTAGQTVGQVGETGNADGCHLHFEIWTAPGWYTGGSPRDPAPDLARWDG